MRKVCLFLLCTVIMHSISAQDSLQSQLLNEVIVTGTKFELPVEKSGKVIFKLSKQDLDRNAGRPLSHVLNQVAGLQMDGNFSSPGANVNYYMRGGRSRHTLITLDGIPLVDPSAIDQFYDLRFLPVEQVEGVEILQGSLSTLYGSGASAGVISIQSRQSEQEGVHGNISAQAGSWSSFGQSLQANGKFGETSFVVMGNNYTTKGFSAAQDNDPLTTFDKDGFIRRNLFFKLSQRVTQGLSLQAYLAIDRFENEYDTWTFTDGSKEQKYKQLRSGIKSSYAYKKGTVDVLLQQTTLERTEQTTFPTRYTGVNWYGELVHKHQLRDAVTVLSGVTVQKLSYGEKLVNDEDTTTFTLADPYTSVFFDFKNGLNLHAGVRLNTHSLYGTRLVYNINPSWTIRAGKSNQIKFLASVSTAYITPTLYQLYTVWGGNADLSPEEDFNVEYGIVLYQKNLQVTAVHFYRQESNSIGYSLSFQYINLSSARYVHGFTLDGRWNLTNLLTLQGNYSYTTTNLEKTFYRIPAHKAGLALAYEAVFGTTFSLLYQFTGKRTDSNFPEEVNLDNFELIDFGVSQSFLRERLKIYTSICNLLDEKFVGIYGYTTPGRNFIAGVNYRF